MKIASIGLATVLLAGCSATPVTQQGAAVEIVNERPGNCKVLGEVVGSQGNVFSGDFTTNENLMIGARNDLRNKAAAIGANVVQMQNSLNATHPYSAGAIKSTLIGTAFVCPKR
ncbi:MAG TPA: DUF4156 domain-containing protein [Acidovorax temperans]|jgi:hypothetical protein|nr:DUF4156 domain-containing protein [Acidovorax temperans]